MFACVSETELAKDVSDGPFATASGVGVMATDPVLSLMLIVDASTVAKLTAASSCDPLFVPAVGGWVVGTAKRAEAIDNARVHENWARTHIGRAAGKRSATREPLRFALKSPPELGFPWLTQPSPHRGARQESLHRPANLALPKAGGGSRDPTSPLSHGFQTGPQLAWLTATLRPGRRSVRGRSLRFAIFASVFRKMERSRRRLVARSGPADRAYPAKSAAPSDAGE